MFIDASAFCAIFMSEIDAQLFAQKLRDAPSRATSSLAIWETAVNVSKALGIELEVVQQDIEQFLADFKITTIAIEPDLHRIALDGYRRFGKGRHPAALNFGDCFAYACARHHRLRLLFKGNDFSQTDIEIA
jgi:ribonuclease VapC